MRRRAAGLAGLLTLACLAGCSAGSGSAEELRARAAEASPAPPATAAPVTPAVDATTEQPPPPAGAGPATVAHEELSVALDAMTTAYAGVQALIPGRENHALIADGIADARAGKAAVRDAVRGSADCAAVSRGRSTVEEAVRQVDAAAAGILEQVARARAQAAAAATARGHAEERLARVAEALQRDPAPHVQAAAADVGKALQDARTQLDVMLTAISEAEARASSGAGTATQLSQDVAVIQSRRCG